MLSTRWSVEERELTAQLIRASMIYHAVMTTGFYTHSLIRHPTTLRQGSDAYRACKQKQNERVIVNNLNLILIYLVYALATVNNVR